MNYIEKFLKEHDLQQGEVFLLDGNDAYIDGDYDLFFVGKDINNNDWYKTVLMGNKRIEKIKPKTLMEQLKEQGFGWSIIKGEVEKVAIGFNPNNNFDYLNLDGFEKYVRFGDIKLTKSDAEREVYRRGLEFEMQEWAREHECLAGLPCVAHMIDEMLNVFVMDNLKRRKCMEIFKKAIEKYYNWGKGE